MDELDEVIILVYSSSIVNFVRISVGIEHMGDIIADT